MGGGEQGCSHLCMTRETCRISPTRSCVNILTQRKDSEKKKKHTQNIDNRACPEGEKVRGFLQ